MLDERLSLVYDLLDPCPLAADIGTDHGQLPAALLLSGRCTRMILTDISESALSHARQEMIRCRLMDRVSLRQGDGLDPLSEACDFVSVTGMGGRTIRDILLRGRDRLRGAKLLLSAHTDLPLVRQAVMDIGYHLEREEPCFAAGRFYLVMRAAPGAEFITDSQVRLGVRLAESASPWLIPWYTRRLEVLENRLRGLHAADVPNGPLLAETRADIGAYRQLLEGKK